MGSEPRHRGLPHVPEVPIWETSRIATDAMDTAVGSVFEVRVMYEVLNKVKSSWRISHKEWLAFAWTVRLILDSLKNRSSVCTWIT